MRGTVGVSVAGPVTDLRAFATILRRTSQQNCAAARGAGVRAGSVADACASSWSRTCTRRRSGRRSGRSCAIRSRRCGGATTSRSSCSRSARGRGRWSRAALRAARALPRAAVRHRPRPLRADGVAGAARAARAGGRDAARQRPARAPLVRGDARGAAVHGADRRGLARVQREPAGRGHDAAGRGAAGRDRPRRASARSPRAEARARLGLDPDGPVPAVPARSRRGR